MGQYALIPSGGHGVSKGKMIIVVDDEDRENEGDLVMAAKVYGGSYFMAPLRRGSICVPLTGERAKNWICPMVSHSTDSRETAFTVSIDARHFYGISALKERDDEKMIDPEWARFYRPGHIFPLIAKEGGVLRRAGHTEATIDLARLAGLYHRRSL